MSNTFNAAEISSKIKAIMGIVKYTALGALKEEALISIRKNFEAGGRPNKWEPRKKISKKQRGRKILVISGNLSNVSANIDSGNSMVVITPNPLARNYAAIHQTGGVINMPPRTVRTRKVTAGKNKGRSVFASARNKRGVKETAGKAYKIRIPARPYLVIPPEDFPRIMSVVERRIKGRL